MHAWGFEGSGVSLGRWLGVSVRADWSLLLIFGLIVFHLGAGAWPGVHPEWSDSLRWSMALAAALLFFLTVLLHELSHAVVAKRLGVDVRGIVLFLFGGMSMLRSRPSRASHELSIAAAGPLTSIGIGVLSLLALGATLDSGFAELAPQEALASLTPGQTLLAWIGPINLLLAAFNLIPGFPLDGGRLLRATLWYFTGDLMRATRWATGAGRLVAMTLMAAGIVMAFGVHLPLLGVGLGPGLWLLLIGWFLYAAARASQVQALARHELTGVPVGDLMRSELHTVDPATSIQTVVRDHVLGTDQDTFPVVREGHFMGLVGLAEIRAVPVEARARVHVADIMREAAEYETLGPQQDAVSAFEQLATSSQPELPVLHEGRFAGLLRRSDLMRFVSTTGASPVGAG